jgi:hypothetical protein
METIRIFSSDMNPLFALKSKRCFSMYGKYYEKTFNILYKVIQSKDENLLSIKNCSETLKQRKIITSHE